MGFHEIVSSQMERVLGSEGTGTSNLIKMADRRKSFDEWAYGGGDDYTPPTKEELAEYRKKREERDRVASDQAYGELVDDSKKKGGGGKKERRVRGVPWRNPNASVRTDDRFPTRVRKGR
jgi:hypothetical protein